MNEYKLTFENNRTCTIECEHSGKPLQDKINEAENRYNSSVSKINDKAVKKHNLGGFLLGAVIGGMLGKSVPAHTVSKTAKSVKANTKKAVRSVKKQVKKFDVGGMTEKIPSAFYKWGQYYEDDNNLSIEDFEQMIQLGDELDGFDVREQDKEKIFFADEQDIDGDDEDGYSVKNSWAVDKSLLPEDKFSDGGPVGSSDNRLYRHSGKFVKKADDTGKGINEGYVVPSKDLYFETEKGLLKHLRSLNYIDADGNSTKKIKDNDDLLDYFYNDEYYYSTKWDNSDIDDQGYYFTKDGKKVLLKDKYADGGPVGSNEEVPDVIETVVLQENINRDRENFKRKVYENIFSFLPEIKISALGTITNRFGNNKEELQNEIRQFIRKTPYEVQHNYYNSLKPGDILIYDNIENYRNNELIMATKGDNPKFIYGWSKFSPGWIEVEERKIFVPEYAKEMGFSLSNLRRKPRGTDFEGKPIYADGGLVGKQIVFERYGEEKIGKITEDLGNGKLVVVSGSGSHAVTPENIISFIDTPIKKKGWFSFKDGGKLVYHNGRKYPTGSAWAVEHNHRNKSEKWEQYADGGPVGDDFVPDGSGYIHEPSGYTLELEFSKGDETYNGTLVEENLYVIYDNDGQIVSSDAEPLEVAKETLLDYISNEFGKGGPVKSSKSKNKKEYTENELREMIFGKNERGNLNNALLFHQYKNGEKDKGFETWRNASILSIETILQNPKVLGKLFDKIEAKEQDVTYPYNSSNPYTYDFYKIYLTNGQSFILEYYYGRPSWSGNVNYSIGVGIKYGSLTTNNKYADGGPVETSEKKYRLLSPDGFDIEMDAVYTESELMPAFEKFKKRFEKQGYYSTSNRTKIDLRDLADYMRILEYNVNEYADGGPVETSEKKVRVYFTVSERERIPFLTLYNELNGTTAEIKHTEKLLYVNTYDNYIDFLCRLENAGISEFRVEDLN